MPHHTARKGVEGKLPEKWQKRIDAPLHLGAFINCIRARLIRFNYRQVLRVKKQSDWSHTVIELCLRMGADIFSPLMTMIL